MKKDRQAFTLIEILLVLVIMGIITAVTLPNLVRAMSGVRLRTSSRMMVTAGRYARSMAVLKQVEVSVVMNLDTGELSVKQGIWYPILEAGADQEGGQAAVEEPEPEPAMVAEDLENEDKEQVDIEEILQEEAIDFNWRFDRVKIRKVEMVDADRVISAGTCAVVYHRNGRCQPYRVELEDEDGHTVRIEVDAIASAKTSSDEEK